MPALSRVTKTILVALAVTTIVVWLAWHTKEEPLTPSAHPPAIEAPSPSVRMDASQAVPPMTAPPGRQTHASAPWRSRSSEPDRYRTYLRLRKSDDGAELFVARTILMDCFWISGFDSLVREVAAGLPMRGTRGVPAAVQKEAALELLARCHGFAGMTKLDVQQARADIGARLHRAEDPIALAEGLSTGRLRISDDLLRSILASQDPVAIGTIADQLTSRWRKAAHLPVDGDDSASWQTWLETLVVGTLVACDLGHDCGSDSFEMREKCVVRADNCTKDLRSWMLTDNDPADRSRIEATVASFVAAIRTGDRMFWGL